MVARIQAALDAARLPPNESPLTAAIYQPGGLSAGANTVVGRIDGSSPGLETSPRATASSSIVRCLWKCWFQRRRMSCWSAKLRPALANAGRKDRRAIARCGLWNLK